MLLNGRLALHCVATLIALCGLGGCGGQQSNDAECGDTSYVGDFTNAALTSLTGLDSLIRVGGGLGVANNRSLTTLGLGELKFVGSLAIVANAMLPACVAQTVYDGLSTQPESFDYTTGNNGVCL